MGLESLFSWPVIFFGLFIYFFTLGVRRFLMLKWPELRGNAYWEDVVLPALPAVFGTCFALVIPGKPGQEWLPHIVYTSYYARVGFGSVTGACSGFIYRIFKAIVKQKWGVDIRSIPPPADMKSTVPPPPRTPTIPDHSHDEHPHTD